MGRATLPIREQAAPSASPAPAATADASPHRAPPRARRRPWLGRPYVQLAPLLLLYTVVTALAQPGAGWAGDEQAFVEAAQRLLDGHYAEPGTVDQTAFLWHGPATSIVLMPFVALGVDVIPMRFLMAPIMFAAVLVFHRLLRVRLEPRPALIGTLAFAFYLPFFQPLRGVHKEPIAVLLVCAALLGLSRYLQNGRPLPLVLGGLAFSGVAMTRLEFGWVIVAMVLVCAAWWALGRSKQAARRATAVFCVALAGCVPWLAYTYAKTDRPLYWGNSGGISLYWMSPTGGAGESGQWHAFHTVFEEERFARYRPFFRRQTQLPPIARDDRFQQVAKQNIAADPLGYVRNLGLNTTRMLFYQPFWPTPDLGLIVMYTLFNGLLILALAWAAVRLRRDRRALVPELVPITAFAVIGLGIHIFPSADPRMVLTSAPAFIWLVAYAAGRSR